MDRLRLTFIIVLILQQLNQIHTFVTIVTFYVEGDKNFLLRKQVNQQSFNQRHWLRYIHSIRLINYLLILGFIINYNKALDR